jgi:NADP-dependent 3-hydroxy acid dehydrogenase YdfG
MTSSADLRVSSLFNVSNHVVLVTGGATGLGEMAAQAFVQNGAKVFIASRKESELKKTSDRLNKLGPGTCEYIIADLKDKAGCNGLVKEMKKRTDRLTVLINNVCVHLSASLRHSSMTLTLICSRLRRYNFLTIAGRRKLGRAIS